MFLGIKIEMAPARGAELYQYPVLSSFVHYSPGQPYTKGLIKKYSIHSYMNKYTHIHAKVTIELP